MWFSRVWFPYASFQQVRQKYGTQHEPSLFKAHPLSCQHNRNRLYSRAIHYPASIEKHYVQWFLLKRACYLAPKTQEEPSLFKGHPLSCQHNRNHLYSRDIHYPTSMEKHYVQWFLLKRACYLAPKTQHEPSLFKGHPFSY